MVGSINNKNRKDYGDSLLILVTLVTLSRKLKEAVRISSTMMNRLTFVQERQNIARGVHYEI